MHTYIKDKKLLLYICAVLLIGSLIFIFWGSILDLLSIDQSGWTEKRGMRYYLDEKGDPKTGWLDYEGQRYHLNLENGHMETGWLELPEGRYYLNSDGTMATGQQTLGGRLYYFHETGEMATGWTDIGEKRYYLDSDGCPKTGWLELHGAQYYLNADGSMATGRNEMEDGTRYFAPDGRMLSGWIADNGNRYYLDEAGISQTGWLEIQGHRYYLDTDTGLHTGWLELPEGRYYMGADGSMKTGWLELENGTYYLKEDGTIAIGRLEIDGQKHYFTSTGARVYLVNRWNYIPKDYTVELQPLENGRLVAAECRDALNAMIADCTAAGCHPNVIDGNRTTGDQYYLFNTRIETYLEQGYSYQQAYQMTSEAVAIPGTSEHQLGLAVDILDEKYPSQYSGDDNSLVWLMENSWKYGFILRYPDAKKQITGIIYEPWHYRYVGTELAAELWELDLCLEEYLDMLTNDGTTCGGAALP